jgi:uncharacterized membrane protein
MARADSRFDDPKGLRSFRIERRDRFGRFTEGIARAMGTPWFLFGLLIFVAVWMTYTAFAPAHWPRIDSVANGFTVLTLALSIQASAGTPLILLAQNRQGDRDRVQIEQDRQRAERNLADTEYLAREVVALRLAMRDMATKDFIRAELRALLEELDGETEQAEAGKGPPRRTSPRRCRPRSPTSSTPRSGARSPSST